MGAIGSSSFSQILKWVGAATAILSLIAGVRGLQKMVGDRLEAHRQIDTLLTAERIQQQSRDYASAWKSLDQARRIDQDAAAVRAAQENLAMDWLENIRVSGAERFSDIAEKLEPVITQGVALEKSATRRADLEAHLGWLYFLRSREGSSGPDPAATYALAAEKDRDNPFAQAMWGHWILWNNGSIADSGTHFSSALSSDRHRDYVRRLQLSALLNCEKPECEAELVRVLNSIRKEQGAVDADEERRLLSIYDSALIERESPTRNFVDAIPPAEQLATFQWLFGKLELDNSTSLLRAFDQTFFEENAGQREAALAGYQAIRRQTAGHPGSLLDRVNAGIKRLARAP